METEAEAERRQLEFVFSKESQDSMLHAHASPDIYLSFSLVRI